MMDLTKITSPFGLLDPETQEALRAHGGPYQFWDGVGWGTINPPIWNKRTTYRVKPQPAKPREWWIARRNMLFSDKASAEAERDFYEPNSPIIHVREVLSDE